jgi:hypothetical protein
MEKRYRLSDVWIVINPTNNHVADLPVVGPIQEGPTPHDPPSHAWDFSSIIVKGVKYNLTPKQRIIVASLWAAWESGNPHLTGTYLLLKADSEQGKMSQIFRNAPIWKDQIILPGEMSGGGQDTYCLCFAVGSVA